MLTTKRAELKLVETALTNKDYDSIDLSKVPAKALSKYRKAFDRNNLLADFNRKVEQGEVKINTTSLFPYEVVKTNLFARTVEERNLTENQWANMKNFVPEGQSALVIADTSGSMSGDPYFTSVGLAIYFAERNKGIWANKFIQFAGDPHFVSFKEEWNLSQKLQSIKQINDMSTDIDKVFKLVLDAAKSSPEAAESMPEHLILISDMEFNKASGGYTNFGAWETSFAEAGLKLPKIIFWNASQYGTQSSPVTKETKNVSMVSGFSTTIFENLFNLEEFTPLNNMLKTLSKYDKYLV